MKYLISDKEVNREEFIQELQKAHVGMQVVEALNVGLRISINGRYFQMICLEN